MKKFILLTAAAAITLTSAKAQDFKATLQKTFMAFDTTKDQQQKVDLSNRLSLIAKKWDNEWLAHYYASVSKAIISYGEQDEAKRDAYLDEADKEHDDAVSILKKENDETYVLAAMIANARLAVKPQSRWMKYGKVFSDDLKAAQEINANNPRIYYLDGQSKFHTPKAFGGGKKAALPYFEKAEPLFATESEDDITKPYWGKRINTYMLAQCKTDDKD
ncbi:MAG TPA: hypothetical protein VN721_12225 [Flavipsychrobacter sp.]|nr:hypothetical protein [Flavipsychrobacter sp.]